MGCCDAGVSSDSNKDIGKNMANEERIDQNLIKMLFLGPGGSGKSTIFKQLQYIHGGGFTDEYVMMLRREIYGHIIKQMKGAITHYLQKQSSNDTNISEQKNDDINLAIATIKKHNDIYVMNDDIANAIKCIWSNSQNLKDVFTDKTIQNKVLDETTAGFWDDIDRIKSNEYIPSEADIINLRYRTTGIIEKQIKINDQNFHFVDVGGQQNERRKWIKCFDEVKAVIFVVSLSGYNENMFEDLNQNAMSDSLQLFAEICNTKVFAKTNMILFLNKTDLFRTKIVDIPITVCEDFSDFETFECGNESGAKVVAIHETIHKNPNDYEQTVQYIRSKFESLSENKNKKIYIHCTCATDKYNVKNVFHDVQRIIVRSNLSEGGFSA